MNKTDITRENLYISKVINVIKSRNRIYHKILEVNGRRSDAFIYILSGSCTYRIDDGYEFTVNKGDIFYLSNRANYTMYIHTTDYNYIYCDFMFDCESPRKCDVYTMKNPSIAENLFRKLLLEYKSPAENSFASTMSTLYSIYGLIFSSANETYISSASKKRISEAKDHIDKNFKDPALSIASLAEKISVSEVYFRKLFKSNYNISPHEYIMSLRLEQAKELMKYPFLSLEDCALQSGFSTLQYFCRVFKNATGTTPAKYRKQK